MLHEGADFKLGAAQIGGGRAELEIVTTVTHAEPNATSRQTVRSVLETRRPALISARSPSPAMRSGPIARRS